MAEVENELQKLFARAVDDLKKGEVVLRTKESLKTAADRFIKLSKRMFDIYKLFETEFTLSIDVIAARAMLFFARSCFTVAHVLLSTDRLQLRGQPSLAARMSSLPRRAAHKIIKRTIKKRLYLYNHDEEDYLRSGFAKVFAGQTQNKRNFADELLNVAVGLKDLGRKLLMIMSSSGLVNEGLGYKDLGEEKPDSSVFTLEYTRNDLNTAHDILKEYYAAVDHEIQQMEEKVIEGTMDHQDWDPDLCLLPLVDRFGMAKREVLRGKCDEKLARTQMLDVINTVDDIYETSRYLIGLDKNIN